MRRLFTCVLVLCTFHSTYAQNVLSLAQCRELALQNNRQLKISKMTAKSRWACRISTFLTRSVDFEW